MNIILPTFDGHVKMAETMIVLAATFLEKVVIWNKDRNVCSNERSFVKSILLPTNSKGRNKYNMSWLL